MDTSTWFWTGNDGFEPCSLPFLVIFARIFNRIV